MRTSQNSVKAKFAKFAFYEVGGIGANKRTRAARLGTGRSQTETARAAYRVLAPTPFPEGRL